MFVSFVCFVVQNFNWIGLWYGDCESENDNDHNRKGVGPSKAIGNEQYEYKKGG